LEAQAFRRELAARGLKFEARHVRPGPREIIGRSSFEQARDGVAAIFGGPREEWPDALDFD
jgi:hypothetical protein